MKYQWAKNNNNNFNFVFNLFTLEGIKQIIIIIIIIIIRFV